MIFEANKANNISADDIVGAYMAYSDHNPVCRETLFTWDLIYTQQSVQS